MKSVMMVRRVLETWRERLLSPDEVSQASLDSLRPVLAGALESGLPVSIRGMFWGHGDSRLRAKVDHDRLHARVWHGDQPSGVSLIAMVVSRTGGEGAPLLEVSMAGTHATTCPHEVTLELGDLVSRIAWCWLPRCARYPALS